MKPFDVGCCCCCCCCCYCCFCCCCCCCVMNLQLMTLILISRLTQCRISYQRVPSLSSNLLNWIEIAADITSFHWHLSPSPLTPVTSSPIKEITSWHFQHLNNPPYMHPLATTQISNQIIQSVYPLCLSKNLIRALLQWNLQPGSSAYVTQFHVVFQCGPIYQLISSHLNSNPVTTSFLLNSRLGSTADNYSSTTSIIFLYTMSY